MRDKAILRPLAVLIVFYVFVIVFCTDYAIAANYAVAVDGTRPFASEVTIPPGAQITFDVYLQAAPGSATSGGAFIDFSASTSIISYVSASVANPPGTYDKLIFLNQPYGPGTLIFIVIKLDSIVPDPYGDIMLGTVTLECTGPGDASITITTIPEPEFETWGPVANGWNDDEIDSTTVDPVLVIHQVCECQNDEDCHDGLWCNGLETCSNCVCIPGIPGCDDGNECSFDLCRESDPICGIIDCEEIVGTCVYYCDTSVVGGSTDSCLLDPICAGACGCPNDWDADGIDISTDNCGGIYNPDQSDGDGDGVGDICDNCPNDYNPDQRDDDSDEWGTVCDPEDDSDGIIAPPDNCPNDYNPSQEDNFPPQGNNIGDACDCESDFDCSGGVDAADVNSFLTDFGRSTYFNPCTNADPCNGDFNCDTNVAADDVSKFLEDFGRSQYFNPCPPCVAGDWCLYEGDPFIKEYSDSGCLGGLQGGYGSSATNDCNAEDWTTAEVVGDSIYVSAYVTYNCCSSIEVELSDDGNNLNVLIQEIFGRACFCNCCFRVDAEIAGLTSDEYTLAICSQRLNNPPICETVVVIVP